jgi:hypothetical protein
MGRMENNMHGVIVGDIFCTEWGMVPLHVDFFEVVAVNGRQLVTIRDLQKTTVADAYMTGLYMPLVGQYADTEPRRVRTGRRRGGNAMLINADGGNNNGLPWDGLEVCFSPSNESRF